MKRNCNCNKAAAAWYIVGGLAALTFAVLIIREIPAIRREAKILSM